MQESHDSEIDTGSSRLDVSAHFGPLVDALLHSEEFAAAVIDLSGHVYASNAHWDRSKPTVAMLDAARRAVATQQIEKVAARSLELIPLPSGEHVVVRTRRDHRVGPVARESVQADDPGIREDIILDAAGEGIFGLDADGCTTFVNAAAAELTGWQREDLLGRHQHDFLHHSRADGSSYPIEECPIAATLRDGRPRRVADEVFWRKDGRSFPVEYTTTPVLKSGNVVGAVVVFRDVTDIRKAFVRRAESEAKFRAIVQALPDAVVRLSRDGVIREVRLPDGFNVEVPREQEGLELDIRTFVGPDLVDTIRDAIRAAFDTGKIQTCVYDWEVAGEIRTREARFVVVGDDEVLAVIRDITAERAAERLVRESEHRFRAIFDSMFQFIGLMHPDGTLIEANQAALDFGGVDASDVIGRKFWETSWWTLSPEIQQQLKDAIARAADGEFVRHEVEVRRFDGQPSVIDFSIKPVRDDFGNVVLLIPEGRDIEEMKRAQRQLAESEERLAGIIDSALDAVMAFRSIRDERGQIADFEWVYTNRRAAEMVNRSVDQLIGNRLLREMPGNREEGLFEAYVRVANTGEPHFREFYYNRDGIEAYFSNAVVKFGDGFMVTFRDVTEERIREEELRSSQRILVHAQTLAGMGSWQWDPQSGELNWSDELHRIYGFEPGTPASFERYIGAVIPEDRERIRGSIGALLERKEPFSYEERIERTDGAIRILATTGEVIEDEAGYMTVVGVCQDVTEARRAEEDLRQSERKLQYAQRIAHLGSWDWDVAEDVVTLSAEMGRIVGISEDTVTFERFLDAVHPEDRSRVERELSQAIEGQSEFKFYYTIVRDGEERIIRAEGDVFADDRGNLQRVFATGHDVTEMRRAEEQIRESEQRFRQLAEQISDLVGVHDSDGRYAYVSPSSTRILGYEPHEMIGRKPIEFAHPDDAGRLEQLCQSLGVSTTEPTELVLRMGHKEGGWHWLELVATPIINDQGILTSIQTSARDVTARVEAQQAAARSAAVLSQRNRELQDFAYVASHDLQEPLRKIRAFAELVIDELSGQAEEDAKFYLTRIQDSAERMATLISDLLAFSRVSTRGKPFVDVDLNAVVDEVVSDLEYLIRDVEGVVEYGDLPTFQADRTQIRQLLQNLIGNGLKFNRPGVPSRIRVSARETIEALYPGMDPQLLIELAVEDNGIGFDEKYLDRIFTPFQRLHNRSEYAGTGMGLAICRRIVERHGGSITATSKTDSGSRFIARLPINRNIEK
jgi:PAS domain S-box-containing protein